MRVLGREVPLGPGFASVPRHEVSEPPEKLPGGKYRVRVQPPTEADKSLTVKLSRRAGDRGARRSPCRRCGRCVATKDRSRRRPHLLDEPLWIDALASRELAEDVRVGVQLRSMPNSATSSTGE